MLDILVLYTVQRYPECYLTERYLLLNHYGILTKLLRFCFFLFQAANGLE